MHIKEWFIEQHKTLSVAESCTGGRIAAAITSEPGSSQYFLGAVISYTDLLKERLLGVLPTTLQQHGAVSRSCAEEMARGALKLMGSDYALSITGIAGPSGGSAEKPVGTVWVAVCTKEGRVETELFTLTGTRTQIQELATQLALEKLRRFIHAV